MNQIDNLVISLLAKQFTVLYGNSGTGKTRLATKLISNIDQTSFIKITVNNAGKIISHSEMQIKELCNTENLNRFEVKINNDLQAEQVVIQNCTVVKSTSNTKPAFISGETEFEIRDTRELDRNLSLNYRLIPVNSNWLDTRPLLGYVNIFGDSGETEYTLTPFLEMVLLASHPRRKQLPHFIILDEMNLAPVEYYLSDILSLMELPEDLNQPLIPTMNIPYLKKYFNNRSIDTLEWDLMRDVVNSLEVTHQGIALPNNLYIIGTINIDDTTHTLSNKVLDRAHMIEVDTQIPTVLVSNTDETVFTEQQEKFLKLMNLKRTVDLKEINERYDKFKAVNTSLPEFKEILNDLDLIYQSLKRINLDFGYRVIKEYLEYLLIGFEFFENEINEEILKTLFSNAMSQKVLSKLHGNRRELTVVIQELTEIFNKPLYLDTKLQNKVRLMGEKLNTKGNVSFLG